MNQSPKLGRLVSATPQLENHFAPYRLHHRAGRFTGIRNAGTVAVNFFFHFDAHRPPILSTNAASFSSSIAGPESFRRGEASTVPRSARSRMFNCRLVLP